jgi:serine/threonine-protein kinase ATR
VATLNPATDNYNWVHGDGSWDGIVAVQAQSAAAFTLTELGVQSGPCLEWATVDMGAVKDVGVVR